MLFSINCMNTSEEMPFMALMFYITLETKQLFPVISCNQALSCHITISFKITFNKNINFPIKEHNQAGKNVFEVFLY